MAPVIAKTDLIVHDDVIGIDRKLFAGQPVPPDLIAAYEESVDGHTAEKSRGGHVDDPPDLNSMTVDELQAEADRRGLEVVGTGKDGNVVKADLVQALSA